MKKILLSLALLATFLSAGATDYKDQLSVSINGGTPSTQTTTISVNDNGDGTYDFSLKDFSFANIPIGDINLSNVPGVEQNGVVYLAATEPVNVKVGIMPLSLNVTLRGELCDNRAASMPLWTSPLQC